MLLSRSVFLAGFRGYQTDWLKGDVAAGLAVAAVALPSAIAYPAIAGLPAETGLYASILPLIGYALFGPSRQLMVGPDAATMTILAAVLATMPSSSPDERVLTAAALALGVGLMCLAASVLRLGVIAAFLSRPILVGFMAGISLSILVGQIGRVTGLKIEATGLIPPIIEVVREAGGIHWPSVALAAVMFAILQVLSALRSPIPGPVVVVVLSVAASVLFDFKGHGIALVGTIPQGLPSFAIPDIAHLSWRELILGAAAVWLVSFGSGVVAARSFAERGHFHVEANSELIGLGAANLAAGFFRGFPVTVSDSRTAINIAVGGKSQVAGLVAALVLIATLVFLNDALRFLPVPALGAILVAAALSLVDFASLRDIWRISRMEFAFAMIGVLGPISLGVLNGVVIAIAGTLLYLLLKDMRPRDALLGRIPGRDGFYKLHRAPLAHPVPGLAVLLIQGSILFYNVDYVETRLGEVSRSLPEGTRWFVIDASAVVHLDSTAAAMLENVRTTLAERGLKLGIAELHNEPMTILARSGVLGKIGTGMIFDDLEDALAAFEASRTAS
jgi:sulfate permease, SulP family